MLSSCVGVPLALGSAAVGPTVVRPQVTLVLSSCVRVQVDLRFAAVGLTVVRP